MQTITWGHECYFCHRPITSGRVTLILAIDKPDLLGAADSACCPMAYNPGQYQLCPPDFLSSERVSFWVHFYPLLYKLLRTPESKRALRTCLMTLLVNAPDALDNPAFYLRKYQDWDSREVQLYGGDLEKDFWQFLGNVRKMANEQPVEIEVDYRYYRALFESG